MVNIIPTPRHSLRYRSFKKAQFDKQRRDNLKSMTDKPIDFFADEKIAKNIASYIDKTSIGELDLLYLYSDTALENKITSFLPDVASAAKIRFKKTLRQGYIDFLDLGIQHTILDYLYMLPKVKGVLDKSPARFSSFDGTLTDFVLGNSETIAEFNSYDDLTKKEKDAIDRADNELNRLANSLDRLGSNGKPGGSSTIDKYALSRTGRLARMSFEERYRFLIIMQDIDNFKKRAEVSKKNFVADTYLDRRYQVLEEDLTGKYNEYVKQRIASFLKEETRYLSTLKGRGASVEELSRDIQAKLAEYDRKVNKLSKKATQAQTNRTRYGRRAETIIATEVSTAYNFGKLLGFSGPEDLEKRLTWRADWELQSNRSNYEVCKYCSLMNGTSYTVRELLVIGTQLDIGAGGFGKDWPAGGRTAFKNPSLPMIPGHPNCSCFWEIAGLEERLTSEELYEDVPIESVKQLDPNALTVPSKAGTLAMQVAGAGLLVGGAFLLARSNLWNTAFSSMFNKNTYTFPLVPFDDVLENVVKYSDDVFDDSVTQAVTDTVINSLPDINLK
jgi:hypothetical protein